MPVTSGTVDRTDPDDGHDVKVADRVTLIVVAGGGATASSTARRPNRAACPCRS